MAKRDPAHEGSHDHIPKIQGAAQWICFNANGKDSAQWGFLPAVINSHDFFKPYHALIGHNVIIVAPIDHQPYDPTDHCDQ